MANFVKKLNLGCGNKPLEGYLNVDIQTGPDIDLSFDFDKTPYPFSDNEFEYIFIDNVLEHLEDPVKVLDELHRITMSTGMIKIIVPYWNAKGAYNDITHKHWFNERSFELLFNVNHSYRSETKTKYEIVSIAFNPTKGFGLLPKPLLIVLSRYLCSVVSTIEVMVKVIK